MYRDAFQKISGSGVDVALLKLHGMVWGGEGWEGRNREEGRGKSDQLRLFQRKAAFKDSLSPSAYLSKPSSRVPNPPLIGTDPVSSWISCTSASDNPGPCATPWNGKWGVLQSWGVLVPFHGRKLRNDCMIGLRPLGVVIDVGMSTSERTARDIRVRPIPLSHLGAHITRSL